MALSTRRAIASASRPLLQPPVLRTRVVPLYLARSFATTEKYDPSTVDRESDQVDVCIVGGGPAGLSAAIRLKQLEAEREGDELRVVVLEKGAEIGEFSSRRGN